MSDRRDRARRLAVAGVGLAVATAVGRRLRRRRAELAPVVADLHHPILYAIPSITSDRSLRVARAIGGLSRRAPIHATGDVTAAGVRVLVYDAPERPRPSGALLWIHGGGMIFGVAEQSDALCTRFAREAGVLVISVDYRLAPEDPFPAGLDDCMRALAWLHAEADALGIDPDRIAVGGDSAGGGLAAAVAQRAHDEGGPAVAFQLLEYPMIDDRTVLRTDPHGGVYFWSPASNRYAWTAYLGRPPTPDAPPPYAAPARREDLAGLPPAWVGVGDLDLFCDEDVDYASRLRAAGVDCHLEVVPGMWHGADSLAPDAPTAARFRDLMVDAVRTAVGGRAPVPVAT
jgi:acetyl esterase/lipase